MSTMLGRDVVRALRNRVAEIEAIEPFREGRLWTRSRGLGAGMPLLSEFRGVRHSAISRESLSVRTVPRPAILDRGHILDGSTLALWRFDEALPDSGGINFADSNGTALTLEGSRPLGVTDYSPIPGQFARVFRAKAPVDGMGQALRSATDATAQAKWIGSWTIDVLVRVDQFAIAASNFLFLEHSGANSGRSSLDNYLGSVGVNDTGKLLYYHENGANAATFLVTTASHVTVGVWHYLSFVKDSVAKTVAFYVDGALVQTISYVTASDGGTSGGWAIGANGTSVGFGTRGNWTCRDLVMTFSKKDQAWVSQNQLHKTSDGWLQTPGSASDRRYWRFGDTSPVALDVSGNGHHLYRVGSTKPSPLGGLIADGGGRGRSMNASYFVTYFDAAIRSALLSTFTLECWINMSAPIPANGYGIFNHGDQATEAQEDNFAGARVVANQIEYFGESGAGVNTVTASSYPVVEEGTLYHLAVRKTLTGGTCTLAFFLNGVNIGTTFGVQNPDGSDNPKVCGFRLFSSHTESTFTGIVDDVRLSNIARTDAEILQSYERGGYVGAVAAGYGDGYATGFSTGVESVIPTTIGGIGYFGAYFGASIATTIVEAAAASPLATIKSPLAPTDPDYVDHTTKALDRLPQYAKHKSTS